MVSSLTLRDELSARVARLQALLARENVDAALLVQKADLFYFSGTTQQAHLFVPATGAPLLLARKSFERARAESAIEAVVALGSLRQIPDLLAAHGHAGPRRVGMELDVLPVNDHLRYRQLFPDAEIVDVSPLVRQVRRIKSPYEIGLMRRAAAVMDAMVRSVPDVLREGMTEVEFAGRLEAVARREGHQGVIWMRAWNNQIFYGHILAGPSGGVASGVDSATGGSGLNPAVPYGPGERRIGRGDPVMVDYIAAVDGYLADQTRMFSIGPLPAEWGKRYEAMRAVQEVVRKAARPGVRGAELYDLAVAEAARRGFADHFMGFGPDRVRFVGHGVGIEIDELPFLAKGFDMPLEPGMVFALEPKLVFPGEGAIGVENTWLVGESGIEPITVSSESLVEV